MKNAFLVSLLLIISTAMINIKYIYALSEQEILQKAEHSNLADDTISKLTYIVKENGLERRLIIWRVWKNYKGESGIRAKVILFHEYPPEFGETAFMGWIYDPTVKKIPDDYWIYVPITDTITKLSTEKRPKIFEGSEISSIDMILKDISGEEHKLLREEKIMDKDYYVIESTPKSEDTDHLYSKAIKWISKEDFLKEKIEHYNRDNILLKTYNIKWKQIDNIWMWEEISVKNHQNNNETMLSISDIQINKGLNDTIFKENAMKDGYMAILSTIK